MKITKKTLKTAYDQLVRELDGWQVNVNHIKSYGDIKPEGECEYGIEIHLGIGCSGNKPMVLKLHADTIKEIAEDCEGEKQKIQEALDIFSSDLECEINIAILTAKLFKEYEYGVISWNRFKQCAINLHGRSKINNDDDKGFVEFLESLRSRVYTKGSNSPYDALLDFDGIFDALSGTNEFEKVLDNIKWNDGEYVCNEVLDELYEKGTDEFIRKMYDADLNIEGSRF